MNRLPSAQTGPTNRYNERRARRADVGNLGINGMTVNGMRLVDQAVASDSGRNYSKSSMPRTQKPPPDGAHTVAFMGNAQRGPGLTKPKPRKGRRLRKVFSRLGRVVVGPGRVFNPSQLATLAAVVVG